MKDINSLTDNKSWFELPTGPTGVRPDNPVAGQMRYDTSENVLEYYNPAVTGWKAVRSDGADYVSATGGTITTDGDYKVHTFSSSSDFVVTKAGLVEYLVVAGGGGAGKGDGAVGIAMCADEKSSGRAGARFGQYMWAGLQPTRNPNQ